MGAEEAGISERINNIKVFTLLILRNQVHSSRPIRFKFRCQYLRDNGLTVIGYTCGGVSWQMTLHKAGIKPS